jgi:hypothetical protein
MTPDQTLRELLHRALNWHDAHADLNSALRNLPPKLRGKRPAGAPHSAWEILEHMRLATRDILEFSRDHKYKPREWPADYWPKRPEPPSAAAWNKSVKALESDLTAMGKFVMNAKTDLFASISHGSGQTVLREALLIADHNAYHLGQLVLVRRLLGCWPED